MNERLAPESHRAKVIVFTSQFITVTGATASIPLAYLSLLLSLSSALCEAVCGVVPDTRLLQMHVLYNP